MCVGGGSEDFCGSEILAKMFFMDLLKKPRFFWAKKKTQGYFWVLYFSSAQINKNILCTIYCLRGIIVHKILGRQILKLGLFLDNYIMSVQATPLPHH